MGIAHIEDLPLGEFIKAVENIGLMHASEKLDGANLWMGLEGDGKFFTTREGKSKRAKRFTSEAEYPKFAAYNGFRSAHAALEAKIDDIKRIMQPNQMVEIEVLYGRQPNAVTYGADNKSYIAFLRGVEGTPDVIADQLSMTLGGTSVKVQVDIVETTDGEELSVNSEEITYQFTGAQKIDSALLKDVNLTKHIENLKKYLGEPSGVGDLTNGDLLTTSLGSVKVDERPDAKLKKAEVFAKVMTDFKLPVKKELLDNFVAKIKPQLADPDLTSDEDLGVEGIVLRDPTTGNLIKLVDKEAFTTINAFNHAIRNQISNVTKTLDPDAPLEARGGIVGDMKNKIADLLGNADLARGSTAKRAFEKVKGSNPVDTIKNFTKNLEIDDFLGTKRKMLALIQQAAMDMRSMLNDFKEHKDEFRLKLKSGKVIGITDEIEKRTLLVFAESRRNIIELFEKIKKAKTVAQMVATLYGNLAVQVHEDGDEAPVVEEGVKFDPTKNKPLASATDGDGYRIEIHSHVDKPMTLGGENELGYPIVRSGTMFIFNPENEFVQSGYWMNWPEEDWKIERLAWLKMPLSKRAKMEAEWQTHAYRPLADQFEDRKKSLKEAVDLFEKKYDTDKTRYQGKDAYTLMNIYFATVFMSVLMYQANDARGIRLVKDRAHYKMSAWDRDMSPLNFWGYIIWKSSTPAVKKLIGNKAAGLIFKVSRKPSPSQSRYLHMDLSFGKDVAIEWSDHRKTMRMLQHFDGMNTDRINIMADGLFNYENLTHDQKVKVLGRLFLYVTQFIPTSPLFVRTKAIHDELLLNANGENDQMVEMKLLSNINALVEDGDPTASPDANAGTSQGSQVTLATRASDANVSRDGGQNMGMQKRKIEKRKRNPEIKRVKFPKPEDASV